MADRNIPLTDIILFAGTRVALGLGIGLLVSGHLNRDQRRGAGIALALVGGLTTIPFAIGLKQRRGAESISLRPAA